MSVGYIHLAIFDLDDTLIMTRRVLLACRRKALATCFPTVDPESVVVMMQAWSRLSWFLPADAVPSICRAIALESGVESPHEELLETAQRGYLDLEVEAIEMTPGASDLLSNLRAEGMQIAVLCNGDAMQQSRKMGRLEWLRALCPEDMFLIADGTRVPRKPSPAGLIELCARAGIEPQRVAHIGDRVTDVMAGHLAGCYTVQYMAGSLAEAMPGNGGQLGIERPDFAVRQLSHVAAALSILSREASGYRARQ